VPYAPGQLADENRVGLSSGPAMAVSKLRHPLFCQFPIKHPRALPQTLGTLTIRTCNRSHTRTHSNPQSKISRRAHGHSCSTPNDPSKHNLLWCLVPMVLSNIFQNRTVEQFRLRPWFAHGTISKGANAILIAKLAK